MGWEDTIAAAQWGMARVLEEEQYYAEALPLAEEALGTRKQLRHKDAAETGDLVARLRKQVAKKQ